MKIRNWRTKIVLLFVLVLSATLLLQVLYVIPHTQDREVNHAETRQEEVARNIFREADHGLDTIESELTSIVDRAEFRNMDVVNQTEVLFQYIEILPDINTLFVMNETGWFVSGTTEFMDLYRTKSYAYKDYFIASFEQGEIYFNPPRPYLNNTLITNSISVPIESDTGERVGVLLGTMKLNNLIENIANYPLGEDTVAYLVDNKGTVVAHSEIDLFALEEGPLSLNYSTHYLVHRIMAGEHLNESNEYDQNGTTYIGTISLLESNGWMVIVETPKDTILSESNKLAEGLWLFNMLLFTIILGITLVFTQQITLEQKRSEEELKKHRDNLEGLVEDRTDALNKELVVRKRVEKETHRLNAELEQKNKELEQIVYITSHDLRSPLVNIQGFGRELGIAFKDVLSTLQSEDVPKDVEKKISTIIERDILESMQYITTSIDKMDSLLTGVLKISRLGRVELKKGQLNMNKMISDIKQSYQFQIDQANANLESSDLPGCYGDDTQINQVFSNLVGNSLKYFDPNRTGSVKISGHEEKGQSIYCIEDNGIGIAPEHNKNIFDMFHQLEPGARKGEGLGLTIVRKIVEKHQGKVWVESEPGKGSKFYVSLPGIGNMMRGGKYE